MDLAGFVKNFTLKRKVGYQRLKPRGQVEVMSI